MTSSQINIETVTKDLLSTFFRQCSWDNVLRFDSRILPFDNVFYMHAIHENGYYRLPCFLVKFIQYGTASLKHPKDIQGLVNIKSGNTYPTRLFSKFLTIWYMFGKYNAIAQRFGKSKYSLHTGPGYLADEKGNLLMLATVDVYTRSRTRHRRYAHHADEDGETVWAQEDVLEKKFYVKNPTLFIHPDIFTEKKWTKLRDWIRDYVIPIGQSMEPFENRSLGSMANRKMNHKINIVFAPMDQFVSKPKEPSVTEDFSGEMNSLMLKNLDKLTDIVT